VAKQIAVKPEIIPPPVFFTAQSFEELVGSPILEYHRLTSRRSPLFPLLDMRVPLIHEPLLVIYARVLAVNRKADDILAKLGVFI
jgi:hypothetical protein